MKLDQSMCKLAPNFSAMANILFIRCGPFDSILLLLFKIRPTWNNRRGVQHFLAVRGGCSTVGPLASGKCIFYHPLRWLLHSPYQTRSSYGIHEHELLLYIQLVDVVQVTRPRLGTFLAQWRSWKSRNGRRESKSYHESQITKWETIFLIS